MVVEAAARGCVAARGRALAYVRAACIRRPLARCTADLARRSCNASFFSPDKWGWHTYVSSLKEVINVYVMVN